MKFPIDSCLCKVEIRRVKPEVKETRKGRRKSGNVEEMGDGDDYNYQFVCNRWLARDEDDGQIVRELVPVDSSGRPIRGSLAGKIIISVFMFVQYFAKVIQTNFGEFRALFSGNFEKLRSTLHRKFDENSLTISACERNFEAVFIFAEKLVFRRNSFAVVIVVIA